MNGDGERNYLTIVALFIALVFVVAATAAFLLWSRHKDDDPRVASTATAPTSAAVTAPSPVAVAADPATTAIPTATAVPVPRPHGTVDVTADPTPIPDAASSIARLRPGFRACYNKGLTKDPSLHGSITIAIVVAPNGDVTSVTTKSGGIDPDVDKCIIKRAMNGTFDASPTGGTISVPIQFVRQ